MPIIEATGHVYFLVHLREKREMYLCSSLKECKYFLVGTIVRRGVRVEARPSVEVGVEIRVESFCAETQDFKLECRQAIFLESHSMVAELLCFRSKQFTTRVSFLSEQ